MLGTTFNFYFFESETAPKGLALVRSHPEVFKESDGATVFHGDEYGLHTRVFINRLGLPTYETKDLGLAELKKEKVSFDLSITVTAKEQDEYFKVVFKALSLARPEWDGQFIHISHGMMRFAEGKMSSRKGNVITGESLLRDLIAGVKEKVGERQLQNSEKVAEQVAVGAIKYSVLKQGSGKDIVFDPEKSLSLEGDSGPYLQYAHTRAVSLLKKAEKAEETQVGEVADSVRSGPLGQVLPLASDSPQPSPASILERTLIHYPEVVERAAKELEPHHITTYLTQLCGAFNSWYANSKVIGSADEAQGLLLVRAFERTVASGLATLGIPVPEEM